MPKFGSKRRFFLIKLLVKLKLGISRILDHLLCPVLPLKRKEQTKMVFSVNFRWEIWILATPPSIPGIEALIFFILHPVVWLFTTLPHTSVIHCHPFFLSTHQSFFKLPQETSQQGMAKNRDKRKGSGLPSASHTSITLREENSGRKQNKAKGGSTNMKSMLKLQHLKSLAMWASQEASIPSLGAFFGHRLMSCGVPDQSLFPCQRFDYFSLKFSVCCCDWWFIVFLLHVVFNFVGMVVFWTFCKCFGNWASAYWLINSLEWLDQIWCSFIIEYISVLIILYCCKNSWVYLWNLSYVRSIFYFILAMYYTIILTFRVKIWVVMSWFSD